MVILLGMKMANIRGGVIINIEVYFSIVSL